MTNWRRSSLTIAVGACVRLALFWVPLVLGATAARANAQAATQALPARLSDAQFWELVSEYSEIGGTFSSENFTSNEMIVGQIAADLLASERSGGAYIGVGPEQNFTYIAALQPKIVFLVDIRRQAIIQHLMYKAIFELSHDRIDFIARLFSRPRPSAQPTGSSIRAIWESFEDVRADSALFNSNFNEIEKHLTKTHGFALDDDDIASLSRVYSAFFELGPQISYSGFRGAPLPSNFEALTSVTDSVGIERSFLATEENFQGVKSLQQKNLIIPVVGDFGGTRALKAVGQYLRDHGTTVTAFYTSNVEQYLFNPGDGWRHFYANVGMLPLDSNSVFIRPNLSASVGSPASIAANAHRLSADALSRGAQQGGTSALAQMASTGAVTGTVRDSASGVPLAGASVMVDGSGLAALSDSVGRYIIPGVQQGTYSLSAMLPGYSMGSRGDVRIASADTAVGDLFLSQPVLVTIDGRFSSSGGGTIVMRMPLGISGAPAPSRPVGGVPICPMADFLAAYHAGRIQTYADATSCLR